MSDPLHVICLSPFLLGIASVTDVKPGEPIAAASQPELTALAAAPVDMAAGERASNHSRASDADRSVEADGEIVPLQELTINLERTSLKGLYRQGPQREPK